MLLDTAEARERLAAAIHELWVHWMTHFQKQVCWQEGVGWIVPEELIVHWQRQMRTAFADLPAAQQDSDRQQVGKLLAALCPEEPPGQDGAAQLQRLQSLEAMLRAHQRHGAEIHALATTALPGAFVHWDHNGNEQEGVVEDVSGFGGCTSVWVWNLRTSKRYRLDIRRIRFCNLGEDALASWNRHPGDVQEAGHSDQAPGHPSLEVSSQRGAWYVREDNGQ